LLRQAMAHPRAFKLQGGESGMKRSTSWGLAGVLAVGLVAWSHGDADAKLDPAQRRCVRECAQEKRACIAEARADMLACKDVCRDTVDPPELGVCMRGCMDVFRAAKAACNATFQSCKDACDGVTTTTSTAPTTSSTTSTTSSTSTSTSTSLPGSPGAAFFD